MAKKGNCIDPAHFLGKYKDFRLRGGLVWQKNVILAFAGAPKRSQALFGVLWLS